MRSFAIGEWIQLNDKVKIKRLRDLPNDTVVFRTIMKEGGEFGWHLHSDCDEYVFVIEGKIVDLMTNETFVEDDLMFFAKKTPHIPIALKYTELIVLFV